MKRHYWNVDCREYTEYPLSNNPLFFIAFISLYQPKHKPLNSYKKAMEFLGGSQVYNETWQCIITGRISLIILIASFQLSVSSANPAAKSNPGLILRQTGMLRSRLSHNPN
jgi:hypothetical protein